MAADRRALIIGGGIGGLAAGVALRRAGWTIRIHERAETVRELGFALLLAPNAMMALRELGVAATLLQQGTATSKVELRQTNGRVLRRFERADDGRIVVALRSVLHGALLGALGEDSIVTGSQAVRFADRDGGVQITFADGSTDVGDVLVGADGVGSVVRGQLHQSETAPAHSGYCAVRGVARGVANRLGDLSAVGYFGDGVEAATAKAGDDAVYWYLSLLSRDIRADRRDARAVVAERIADFDGPLQAIIEATKPGDLRCDELFVRPPLVHWGTGRVTLLGDAAHPMLPHTGQGAAQAMEDAVALGAALEHGTGTDAIKAALRSYEATRARRTRRFVLLGPRIARVTTTHNRAIQFLRTAAIRLIPTRVLANAANAANADV